MFGYFGDQMLIDRWPPTIGDTGGETVIPDRAPPSPSPIPAETAVEAWLHYRTPLLARLACGPKGEPIANALDARTAALDSSVCPGGAFHLSVRDKFVGRHGNCDFAERFR